MLRNEGFDLVENGWGRLGMFVGEAAVDLGTVVYAGEKGRIKSFHDEVDIGEVREAMRG